MSNTNHDVAHLWANQSKSSARSSNGNFSFQGPVIYSYGTPIGRLILDEQGRTKLVLRTRHKYSVTTTGKHESAISRALRIDVPCIYVDQIGYSSHFSEYNHADNVRYFEGEIESRSAKARKSWQHADYNWQDVQELVDGANLYVTTFGIHHAPFAMPDDWQDALAKARERVHRRDNPDPASADKRERERARKLERKRQQEAEAQARYQAELARQLAAQAEDMEKWKAGDAYVDPGYAWPMMLRIQPGHPDVLETSKRARVPLEHAKRIFRMAQRAREAGEEFVAEWNHRPHVGDFYLDRIDSDGTIHAGCHTIPWQESARMAAELGLIAESVAV